MARNGALCSSHPRCSLNPLNHPRVVLSHRPSLSFSSANGVLSSSVHILSLVARYWSPSSATHYASSRRKRHFHESMLLRAGHRRKPMRCQTSGLARKCPYKLLVEKYRARIAYTSKRTTSTNPWPFGPRRRRENLSMPLSNTVVTIAIAVSMVVQKQINGQNSNQRVRAQARLFKFSSEKHRPPYIYECDPKFRCFLCSPIFEIRTYRGQKGACRPLGS